MYLENSSKLRYDLEHGSDNDWLCGSWTEVCILTSDFYGNWALCYLFITVQYMWSLTQRTFTKGHFCIMRTKLFCCKYHHVPWVNVILCLTKGHLSNTCHKDRVVWQMGCPYYRETTVIKCYSTVFVPCVLLQAVTLERTEKDVEKYKEKLGELEYLRSRVKVRQWYE